MLVDLKSGVFPCSASNCPAYGRFVEPDPIGYEAGPNLYAYVGNDPVNRIDPLGLDDLWRPPHGCSALANVCGPSGGFELGLFGGNILSDMFGNIMGGIIDCNGRGQCSFNPDVRVQGTRRSRSGTGGTVAPIANSQPRQGCIPLSAGPVMIDQSYGLDIAIGVGGGFGFSHFRIPSTGDQGWVATGSFIGGLGVSYGYSGGVVDTLGGLLGEGYRLGFVAPGGAGGEWSFDSEGNVNGVTGNVAAGAGVFGGKTKTRLRSSTRPVCRS